MYAVQGCVGAAMKTSHAASGSRGVFETVSGKKTIEPTTRPDDMDRRPSQTCLTYVSICFLCFFLGLCYSTYIGIARFPLCSTYETRSWRFNVAIATNQLDNSGRMGGAVSVADPSQLRREYEALAAKNVGDQELLDHMKKLIISPPAGEHTMGQGYVRRS